MPELGPRIPENLTGQGQENIARLTEKLTQTLASIPAEANYRTNEMIKKDGDFLRKRLGGGLFGLGRKRVDLKKDDDLDDLWMATQIVGSTKEEALKMYLMASSALLQARRDKLEGLEGLTAEDIHNELIRREENGELVNEWLLNELNSQQIIHGDYAVLGMLDDLIKEEQAKEETQEITAETGDYAVLDLFVGTNRGGRDENQDFVAYWHPKTPEEAKKYGWEFTEHEAKTLRKGNIVVVADGVSLSADGKRASKEAGSRIVGRFINNDESSEEPLDFLRRAMVETNEDIYVLDPNNFGSFETTAVTALIRGHNLYLSHIGDSRAYILRNGMLHRLTRDHSWVEEIEDGKRTLQQFRSRFPQRINPTRNIITRSMGSRLPLEVDDTLQGPIEIAEGDKILFCTDGLWGPVNDQTIAAILSRSKNSTQAVTQLITEAVHRGGEHADNIGVSVINVENLIKGKEAITNPQTSPQPPDLSNNTKPPDEESPLQQAETSLPTLEMGAWSEFAPVSKYSDDYVFIDESNGFAAVFDGESIAAGNITDGKDTAMIARNVVADSPILKNENPSMLALLLTIRADLARLKSSDPSFEGQTTASIVKLINHDPNTGSYQFVGANVGNSRIYVFDRQNNKLVQISKDDTPAVDFVDENDNPLFKNEGDIMKESEEYFRWRNTLTKVLSPADEPSDRFDANILHFTAQKGDLVILTTRGVHNNNNRTRMENIIRSGLEAGWSSEKISMELVLKAREFAERDITRRAEQSDATAVTIAL